jgi:hypothetical protein
MEPTMTDLNTRLCERLRAIEACPVCGARRREFDAHDRLAIAVFDCGTDVVVNGGCFIVLLGCKTRVADAFALIKAEEEAKLEQVAS